LKKRKEKGFSKMDLTAPKANRPKNGVLLSKLSPVGWMQIATGPLNYFERAVVAKVKK